MNVELIDEKLKVTNERLDNHDKRFDNHGERIKSLERTETAQDVMIKHLCEKLEKQIKCIYWLMGIIVTALAGFFFYAVRMVAFY